ncbi:MAG: T9SS type A sorting domain-containing protein, partial [Bacteroidia bacterium]|nr:T9SS type A sorting domain-containing protein [Bacteroidia bacterium]
TFDPAVSGSGNQIITYTYSDQYGCSDSAQDSAYVDLCTGFMALQNSAIKVYPNPATDILHIDNLQSNTTISILDVTGKEIIKFSSDKLDATISLTNLSSGLYFIKIQTMEKDILIYKILKN